MLDSKLLFLHIPKTAGQSVHAAIEKAFGKSSVCPARVNDQLRLLTAEELSRYRVFSGHFDWEPFDKLGNSLVTFTVLRDPLERILSFYFYLRSEGERLTSDERRKPEKAGLRAAFELSPDEYFLGASPELRNFIDDHYDNFYTYYFASRRYHGRGPLLDKVRRGLISEDNLIEIAFGNISKIDKVFSVVRMDEVFGFIKKFSGPEGGDEGGSYILNRNGSIPHTARQSKLRELGAGDRAITRISEFCNLDNQLFSHLGLDK